MKITRVEVFVLGDPPGLPGEGAARVTALPFVRVHTDEGLSGVAEVFSVPPGVARAALDGPDSFFGRQLVGEDPMPPERLRVRLYDSLLHGNRRGWSIICLGAAEVALWDIFGQALGRPVWQLLGTAERSPHQTWSEAQRQEAVPYCTIVSDHMEPDRLVREHLERIERLRAEGFRAFKVEPMRSSPQTVVELARQARRLLGPEPVLCVDVGYLWNDVGMALDVAERLAELGVYFLETPFPVDSLEAYARLAARSPVRIAAGEHTVTRWEFLDLMDRGGCLVVQPYMATCGGLSEAKRIVELAQPRGVLVCPGNWSTHVQSAATVQLVATSPISPIFEYVPAQVYDSPLRRALQEIGLPVVRGGIRFPGSPGIGVRLPEHLIQGFRVG
ncbi:MAG: mandelate racemase/muconate lactonizing enzyme family protein [Planctomycetes bacterium]|nr:mandelate racemase/muconate lactonizing enzyme family protein [Planctomycetota bacterium]